MADGPDGRDPDTPLLRGWMIVTIVAILTLSAVGITALVVSQSSSTTTTSTTIRSAIQTTVTTTTEPVTTTSFASLTNFVGTWSMHDGGLIIAASGVGTVTVPGLMYGGCGQTAQIQVSPASATTALATITAIQLPTCSGVGGDSTRAVVGALTRNSAPARRSPSQLHPPAFRLPGALTIAIRRMPPSTMVRRRMGDTMVAQLVLLVKPIEAVHPAPYRRHWVITPRMPTALAMPSDRDRGSELQHL